MLLLLLALVEGLSSLALFALEGDLFRPGPGGLRRHIRYDPDLGWCNRPDSPVPDRGDKGRDGWINSQSFRADRDYPKAVPPGKARLLCLGDSFTFGWGVPQEATWCSRLGGLDPRFETVNMGVCGYGADQAYLWYRRDGGLLDHDVLLFSFVAPDLHRMLQANDPFGRGKPQLRVEGDVLRALNTPVPRAAFPLAWMARHGNALRKLRTVRLLEGVFKGRGRQVVQQAQNARVELLTEKVLADLRRLSAERGAVLVLAYLPTREDTGGFNDPLRRWIAELCRREGYPFLDLTPAFSAHTAAGGPEPLFLEGDPHYSEAGHRLVADLLREALPAIPAVAERLEPQPSLP